MTASIRKLWSKFAKSKTARHEFVAGYVKRAIPAQIRHLMKQHGLTQAKLAEQAGLTQGVISRAADLNYGDLTLNTIVRIAAGFDCAFVGKYVSYSDFLEEIDKKIDVDISSFEDEDKQKNNQKNNQDSAAQQEQFNVTKISHDVAFLYSATAAGTGRTLRAHPNWGKNISHRMTVNAGEVGVSLSEIAGRTEQSELVNGTPSMRVIDLFATGENIVELKAV